MMPNMPYVFFLLSTNLSVVEQQWAPQPCESPWTQERGASAALNMCWHSRIKTVLSKSHNRRSCFLGESDANTYEGLFFLLQTERWRLFWLLFSWRSHPLLPPHPTHTHPPLLLPLTPPPIKEPRNQLWFIMWIKQDRIILLTRVIENNSCELWGTLCVQPDTHTHTLCLCPV